MLQSCGKCGESGQYQCASCKSISYCSKEHQKEHWKEHKDICKAYQVKSSSELGRHLVASRDLQPGDLVLTEQPLVFGPKSTATPDFTMPCVGCYRPVSTEVGERCPKCGWPVCSGYCKGLTNPLHHGLECHILSMRPECALENMPDYYRHDALLPLRCLLLQQRFPKKWTKLMEMQSHVEDRPKESEIYMEADDFIVRYLMENFLLPLKALESKCEKTVIPDASPELIHKICGIIDTNALEIRLNTSSELLALYTNTCIMEHNCVPNTKHLFDVKSSDDENLFKITVKVVIPLKKDDHITTMYSHALWGTQARRQHLKDTKYFSCTCERCKDPTEIGTYISAMKCIDGGATPCAGIHLPENPLDDETEWACSKCPVKVKNSDVEFIIGQMAQEVDDTLIDKPDIKNLENLITKLSTFLHPNHYHLYTIRHSLIQLYGQEEGYLPMQLTEEQLDKKIGICQDMLKTTRILDPGNARLSLYTAVIEHELHFALVLKVKKLKRENKINNETEKIELIREASIALNNSLNALVDEKDYSAGEKLYDHIKNTENAFNNWLKELKITI